MLEFLSSNQGAGNAGKLLKVDTDGSVIAAEVAGATVDDALSTVSTNPVQNKVITEELLATEGRVDYLEDQLYDEVTETSEREVFNHTTMERPYATSTFTGWAACIGHPDKIYKIIVPFKVRTDYPVSSYRIGIFKLTAPITDADFSSGTGITDGLPYIGSKLVKETEKTVTLETPISSAGEYEAIFILDEQIDNTEAQEDYLIEFVADNVISYGAGLHTTSIMKSGYGPGYGWTTAALGSIMNSMVGVASARFNTSNVDVRTEESNHQYSCAVAKVYAQDTETYEAITDSLDGKFGTLTKGVNDNLGVTESLESVNVLDENLLETVPETIDHIEYNRTGFGGGSSYNTSTFNGWGGSVGYPEKINYVDISFITRTSDYPVTKVTMNIFKVLNKITDEYFDTNPDTGAITGNPYVGEILETVYQETKNFDEPLEASKTQTIRFELPTTIDNTDDKQYIVEFYCNNCITWGYQSPNNYKPWKDDEHGPWVNYSTWNESQGKTAGSVLDKVGRHSKLALSGSELTHESEGRSPQVPMAVGWIETLYHKEFSDEKMEVHVENAFEAMGLAEQLEAAQAASELVEPATIVEYQGSSSLDLVTDPTSGYTYNDPTSTFDGECFPIGPVPAEVPIGGFRVPLKIRSYSSDTDVGFRTANLAKVELWACDYTMENGTTTWSGSGSDPNFNPVKVAEKSISIDLDLDNPERLSGVYDFVFDEPFYNTEGKHLYLAYWINARICRPKASANLLTYLNTTYSLGLTSVKSFYSAFTTKQTSVVENIGKSNRWQNDKVIAFSIITGHDGYIASDLFNEWVDERTEDTVVEQVDDYLSHHDLPVPASYEVRLAKKYYAVKGDKLQLFYDGLVKGVNPSKTADVVVNCSVGAAFPRYWEFTPSADNVGHSYPLTLAVRNFQGQVISSMTTSIEVVDVPTYDTATSYSMLGFGDSLTSSGTWFGEGLRRLVGTATSGVSGPASLQVPNLSLTSYGKKSATNNTYLVHHEGYGGWTWGSFLATTGGGSTVNGIFVTLTSAPGWDINIYQHSIWVDQNNKQWKLEDIEGAKIKFDRGPGNTGKQSETQLPTILDCASLSQSIASSDIASTAWESGNPFYDDDTGRVNFVAHATELGAQPADIVSCLLTWNGGGGPSSPSAGWAELPGKINAHMANATTLLRDIHNDLPNAKIICVGIQLSSVTGGNGQNYGAVGSYSDTFGTNYYAFDYDQALENLVTNEEFGQYCYYVDTKGQFDTEDLMPYTSVAKNTRSSNTENRGTNGVHPSTAGYYAIGDAYFRTLVKVLNDIHS